MLTIMLQNIFLYLCIYIDRKGNIKQQDYKKKILLKMAKCRIKTACVFEQFAKINQIPRPSKHEEQMISYLQEFAKRNATLM